MATRPTDLADVLIDPGEAIESVGSSVPDPVTGAAFWAAVALPFLYLPLLFLTGLSSQGTTAAFVALLTLNVVALLVGHPHYRE